MLLWLLLMQRQRTVPCCHKEAQPHNPTASRSRGLPSSAAGGHTEGAAVARSLCRHASALCWPEPLSKVRHPDRPHRFGVAPSAAPPPRARLAAVNACCATRTASASRG